MPPRPGFVYLIESAGLHKVGITGDLRARMDNYLTHNPHGVNLVATIFTGDPKRLEQTMHAIIEEKRVKPGRDWFKLTKRDVKLLVDILDGDLFESDWREVMRQNCHYIGPTAFADRA